MKEIMIKLYEYDELSEEAKKNAVKRMNEKYIDYWSETEKEILKETIFYYLKEEKNINLINPEYYWDVFTQGEFFAIKGKIEITECLLKSLNYTDKRIIKEILKLENIKIDNKYPAYINKYEVYDYLGETKISNDFINKLNKYLKKTYTEIIKVIKEDCLYIGSEKYVKEFADINEILFTSNGKLFFFIKEKDGIEEIEEI